MRDYYALRIERLERLVLAIAHSIQSGKQDKHLEYFMIGQDPDKQADFEEVRSLLESMEKDMQRTSDTGQI